MKKDVLAALSSEQRMDEYLEVRETAEIIADIKEAIGTDFTKRERIAVAVLSGLCSNPGGPFQKNEMSGWGIVNCTADDVAKICIQLADAMLAASEADHA